MRRSGPDILFSPSDLNTFLACRHAATLQRMVFEGLIDRPARDDEMLEVLRRRGDEHEKRYLAELRDRGLDVLEIPATPTLDERIALTAAAMRAGVAQVIFQAALRDGKWAGFADFLLRVDAPGGGHAYEIVDTKLSTKVKPSHGVQLALYAGMVTAMHGTMPPALRVRLGPSRAPARASPEVEIDPAQVMPSTRVAMQEFEDFSAAFDPDAAPAVAPDTCAHCKACDFRSRCEAERDEAGHLSVVANIRAAQVARLRAHGIGSLGALAAHAGPVPGMRPAILDPLREQARLQLATRAQPPGPPPAHRVLPVAPGEGFLRLPAPDAGDVFFDMEGYPQHPEGGIEYLFGAWIAGEGGGFRTFWGHDRAGEKLALEGFLDWLDRHLATHPGAHVYHYHHYETSALRRLARHHATREATLDALLSREVFVDLHVVVREQLRLGEPRYSLKNVERLYRASRDGHVADAGASIAAYARWCATGNAEILADIEAYNRDDCVSTQELRDWLVARRPAGLPWFAPAAQSDAGADGRGNGPDRDPGCEE